MFNAIDTDKVFELVLNESSLSRIVQHMQNKDQSFAVISPFANPPMDAPPEQKLEYAKRNKERFYEMVDILEKNGLGFIQMAGGYKRKNGEKVVERSFFIPKISKEQALQIGKHFGQETIIHADGDEMHEYGTSDVYGFGKTVSTFNRDKLLNLKKSDVTDVWSHLIKGSHGMNGQHHADRAVTRVLDTHILNPETGNKIKVKTALSYGEGHPAYQRAKQLHDKAAQSARNDKKFLFVMERRTPTSWLTEWRCSARGDESELWFRIR